MKIYWLAIFLFCFNWASAQCDFYEDITGLSMSGFTASDHTQEYVLVAASGNIEQINSTPDFLGLSAGNYDLYGINYEGSRPAEIAVGSPWSGISAIASCFDESTAYNVAVCDMPVVTPCEFYENITGLSVSGATAGDNTQEYVLVNSSGNIEQINSTPDFLGLTAGDYELYGINYEGLLPSEIAIGSPWSGILAIASCFDATLPYLTNVCEITPPNPTVDCEFVNDIMGLSVTGAEAGGNTQEYVLVFATTNEILNISTVPDFFNLTGGDYLVYGINYEGLRPPEITVGNLWSGTSAITSCFDATDPYITNVCEDVCDNADLIIETIGFTTSGSFSQTYILVDTDADAVVTSNATGTFSNTFYAATDNLEVYALNTEDTALLASITDGATWSTLLTTINAATCADILGPRDFTVLPETSASCCTSARMFIRG